MVRVHQLIVFMFMYEQGFTSVPNAMLLLQVGFSCRDTQTVEVRNKYQQVRVDAATQMVSTGVDYMQSGVVIRL